MTIVTMINILFLFVSILFYLLFAGADFGAGILEAFIGKHPNRKEQMELMGHAIAPVWEANHVWLILAVVISFVGFPPVYEFISIYLHVPIILALMGIVARGTAFTFRHYDPYEPKTHKLYSYIFRFGSFITPFFLGTVVGAITMGTIDPDANRFSDLYLKHWLHPFSISLGIFTCALCAFLAAIYLTGETRGARELIPVFRKKSIYALIFMVVSGAVCLLSGFIGEEDFSGRFTNNPLSIFSVLIATILLIPLYLTLKDNPRSLLVRGLGVVIVTLILSGWSAAQWPYFIRTVEGGILVQEAASPEATQEGLLLALVVGSLLIFPALGYLFKIFKWEFLKNGD